MEKYPSSSVVTIGGNPFLWHNVWRGWVCSQAGNIDASKEYYRLADSSLSEGRLNPNLSILRQNIGEGGGSVKAVPPTEDRVVSLFLPSGHKETTGRYALGAISEENIEKFVEGLETWHGDNIKSPRPHVMVLSTGRCGTVSLYKLFEGSNLEPHHSYWFMASPYFKWEMACRLFSGSHESFKAPAQWAESRAAEWLGEKPMIGLNHTDTIFAPVFAAIHKESKFVYLRRDSEKVFNSFYTKNQYRNGASCLRPVRYDFDIGFRFILPPVSTADGIHYHLNATEEFSRAFGRVMGDRFIEISADQLFAQDRDEVAKLLEFVGSDIDLDVAVEHFSKKINEKKHKETV